ncbi:unnamed protein product, partial [Allacma fusca]
TLRSEKKNISSGIPLGSNPTRRSSMGRGIHGSVPLAQPEDTSNAQNPEEEPLTGMQSAKFVPGSDPSDGDDRVEIGAHSKNGKSANDSLWVKYRQRILCILFGLILLVILVIILVIILSGSTSAKTITVIDTNEIIGPTAGPYYHIDLARFGGNLQGVSNEKIAYLEALGIKSVIISQV